VRMAAAAALDLNKRSIPKGSTVPSADLSVSAREAWLAADACQEFCCRYQSGTFRKVTA
jgi:hypothetical protein